jgi:hypothetical protein
MLVTTRRDLAANLAAYGEHKASPRIASMSEAQFRRVCEIGFQHALSGSTLVRASCLAAIEVLEGRPRPLARRRRVWADVPAELLQLDPKTLELRDWFARYAGGEPVGTKQVLPKVTSALAPILPGFRYYRSYTHFRSPFEQGTSYVALECSRGKVQLRFGVTHDEVEALRRRLFEGVNASTYPMPRTIMKYTPNMGPTSPHWRYPIRPVWPISGSAGLARACPEVVAFVQDVALPYVIDHRDPRFIRDTLLNHPGEADGLVSKAQTAFAIDCLLRERGWLDRDYAHFTTRYAGYIDSIRQALECDYQAALEFWNAAP